MSAALRFVSPERAWRAGLLPVPGAWFGWAVYHFFGIMAVCVAGAAVRVPWPHVTGFQVQRPSGLWEGFCVVAACRGGTEVGLLSTRVYSRSPSARHLPELHQTCQTLRDFSPPTASPWPPVSRG